MFNLPRFHLRWNGVNSPRHLRALRSVSNGLIKIKRPPKETGGQTDKIITRADKAWGRGAPISHFGNAATISRHQHLSARGKHRNPAPHEAASRANSERTSRNVGLSLCAPGFHQVCLYRPVQNIPPRKAESKPRKRYLFRSFIIVSLRTRETWNQNL